MYDQAVTGQQLENAEKRLGQKLRRYSVDEVIAARARLDSLYDESGKPTRTPTSEEKRFIQNERTLCRWDFNYWCSRYHHILHWDQSRGIVRFEPNIAQKIFLDIISAAERRAWAIMLLILKARQLGMSTLCEAIVCHRVQFHSNVRAIIASARPGQSEKMFGMMELSWENQPWYLKPFATFHRVGELIAFAAQNSLVSVEHGAKIKSDIGRGSTPSMAHLSEVSEFLNPKDDIDAALLNAIHENPGVFVALESTAKGMGNWWHQKWLYAKEHYDNIYQPSRLRPVFLPWYTGIDLYPTETWLRRNPIPEAWQPGELTKNHARNAESYVADTLAPYFSKGWSMPREQQWFWEVSYREAKDTRTLNKFFTEMCSTDIEAFQQEQQSVFDVELLTEYRNACPRPEGIYALEGPLDEIRAELRPDRRLIDTDQPPVTIDHRYQMVPLKMTGYPNIDPHAKILIWRKPQDEYEYALGVDTSDGVGLDRSVIQVVRKATLTECALQCAEFASPYIGAADLVPFAYAIGKYYQRSCQGELREPQMVVEVNNGGDACQLGLRKQGWNNFYHWVKLDRKILQPSRATVLGVVTSTWYRKVLTEYLTKALKDCFIEINSPWFVNEMGTLGRDEDVSRIRAESGTHDDRFFALGFAFIALHIYDWQTDYKSVFGRPHSALLPPPAQTEYATLPPTAMEQPVFDAAIDRVINGEAPFEERPNYDSFMTEAPVWDN